MGQALHFSPVLLHSLTHSTRAKREREKEKKKERLNKKNVQLRFISVAIREGGS
jgi:macrodomain Ter protein organizer (MatP/YcbG family)